LRNLDALHHVGPFDHAGKRHDQRVGLFELLPLHRAVVIDLGPIGYRGVGRRMRNTGPARRSRTGPGRARASIAAAGLGRGSIASPVASGCPAAVISTALVLVIAPVPM